MNKEPKALSPARVAEEKLAHTDHPSRHWDRTCPACIAEGPPGENPPPESPAKEQPGEQNAAPYQDGVGTPGTSTGQPKAPDAVAAPDVASMVKRLLETEHDTGCELHRHYGFAVARSCDCTLLIRKEAAALIAKLGQGWVPVSERLPDNGTPVLILRSGDLDIGEIRWDMPGFEDTYKAFRYWDNPNNDGQAWEWNDITHWMPLPSPPGASDE